MQCALIQQLVAAIELKYISTLRNRIAIQLPPDIRNVFLYIFRVHGKIKPKILLEKKRELETKMYDISDPIDTIFNKIEI